jgi:hypothetical protein
MKHKFRRFPMDIDTRNNIVIDMINALSGKSSVNTVQHATIEDPTEAPIDWLDTDHIIQ